ncbi:MAG: uncharacterized membrane protein (UPF0127 family) [Halobacteriales archaeon]|jgi:uncharacterized membrane protein (UPF0127 family)
MDRRAFLSTLGLAAIAGCLGGGTGGERPATTVTPSATPADPPTASSTPTSNERLTPTLTPVHTDYETTKVQVHSPDRQQLGSVRAALADTAELRYLGLSDTESLPEDRGMLFVYDSVGDRTFVMREMDFGLDIVYADDEGVITTIHHAPAPGPDEDGNNQRYPGRGQYILEVNFEWTTNRGITAGDVLAFDL